MASPSPMVSTQLESYDQIPVRLRPAYELSPLGWYEPNEIGATIGAYRSALSKDPDREPLAPRRKLTRQEWSTLLSVADPKEKSYFIRALVSKRITLKD